MAITDIPTNDMINLMPASPDAAAFVLAGGKSSRMGTDKAFLEFNGRGLLTRALDLARSITPNVSIVGAPAKFAAFAPAIDDIFPGCGPLGGIHAALRSSTRELNLILAVDLPFLSTEFLRYLTSRAQSSKAVATVPKSANHWQPLCAVYRAEFAEAAEQTLRSGKYKIDPLFRNLDVQTLDEAELISAGFSPDLFRNLNTPEDVRSAQRGPGSRPNPRS